MGQKMKFLPNFDKKLLIFWVGISLWMSLIIWAGIFKIEKSILVTGVVKPFGNSFTVESVRDGKVVSVNIEIGNPVLKGDELMYLDSEIDELTLEALYEDLGVAQMRYLRFQLLANNIVEFPLMSDVDQDLWVNEQRNFLAAQQSLQDEVELLESDVAVVRARIAASIETISAATGRRQLLQQQFDLVQALFDQGFEGELGLLDARLRYEDFEEQMRDLERGISEDELQIFSLNTRIAKAKNDFYRLNQEGVYEASIEVNRIEQSIASVEARVENSVIVAPIDGRISRVLVRNIGRFVNAGEAIAEVVPLDVPLMLYVKIPPEHISNVMVGHKAYVELSNLESRNNEKKIGAVVSIDGSATIDDQGVRFFEAVVEVVGISEKYLIPGVQGTASLLLGTQTVASYFLEPILDTMAGSMSE